MKNIDTMTKCKIGNKILQNMQAMNINAGSVIDIHIETTKSGTIKKIEIKEEE